MAQRITPGHGAASGRSRPPHGRATGAENSQGRDSSEDTRRGLGAPIQYLLCRCAMATARTPSTARDPASRLAATVAREIELLTAQRERVRHRQNDLRARLRDLDDELSALNKRQHDLDRLLGDHRVPAAASRPRLLGGATLRRHAVAHLLTTGQHHDIHYRTWYEQLAADGLLIRGANPAATFLTNITRSPLITRGERPGTYRLDPDAPQRINTLLVKARDRLHATAVARTDNAPQRPERLRALVKQLQRLQREITECHQIAAEQTGKDPPRTPAQGGLSLTAPCPLVMLDLRAGSVAPAGASVAPRWSADATVRREPVITRVVGIEELPPGSPATRRVIAAWSDGTRSEALAWFSDEWLVSEGDLIGLTRDQVRALAHRRDRQWLRDEPPRDSDQQPFFGA